MKRFSTLLSLILFVLASLALQSCDESSTGIDFSPSPDPYNISQAVRDTMLEGGIEIYVIEESDSPFEVTPNDKLTISFTARTEDGKIFDSSYYVTANTDVRYLQNLTPNTIPCGNSTCPPLVEGFRKGLIGMKEGEKRTILVPSELGYSNSNPGPYRNDLRGKDLRYDVTLLSIAK